MNEQAPHIIFIGESGFPVGFGAVQRMRLIAKGMIEHGGQVTIISRKGVHGPEQDFPAVGSTEGISYRYTSGTIHRPAGFWRRNWLKLVGKLGELWYIRQQKRKGNLRGCLVSTMNIDMLFIYWVWLKLLRVPLVLNYDELNSAIPSRTGTWRRINDYLFDRWAVRLTDGVTPISEFLIRDVKKYAPGKPFMKLPILCDFGKFDPDRPAGEGLSFTYCGAASYRPLILFILEAFDQFEFSPADQNIYLDFILGGSQGALRWVKEQIAQHQHQARIRLYANAPHAEIPNYYAKATALLIPMRPTVQDEARFPHKFGEYLASGRPVITTAYGEVRHYDFIDGKTALVAEEYDPEAFAAKMKFVQVNPDKAREIGQQGRAMGIKNFNYRTIGRKTMEFVLHLSASLNGLSQKIDPRVSSD